MSKYKLTQKTNADGTTQDIQLDASSVDLSGYVPTSRTINSKALYSNITLAAADVKALPNYSLSISTGSGNPREVRFVRVNYTTFDGNNAAYFRIGAMCSHGNGSSYTFLEDIIIGVSAAPSVTCTIYKQVQNTSTYTIDGHSVHFGDVYWVVDTTNKYVDFYIIGGQYATLMFTPFMRIGNTVSDTSKIVQYTSANYYSSGTRVWDATGNGSLYARTSDISGKQDTLVSGTNIKTINNNSLLGSGNITISADTSNLVDLTSAQTISGVKTMTNGLKVSGRSAGGGDDEGIVVGVASNNYAGVCCGSPSGRRAVFYLKPSATSGNSVWRYNNGSTTYDIAHPEKAGTIALTDDIAGKQDTLVSGTNIKTINGSSVLGSGDLTVSASIPYIADQVGGTATASGTNSCAFGSTSSSAGYSVAIGYGATNSGNNCVSIGYNAVVSDTKANSVVIGKDTQANDYGTAVGYNAKATGSYGVGLGYLATASKESAIAIGRQTLARYNNTIVIGNNNTSPNSAASTRIGCAEYTYTGRALILGAGATSFTYMNAAGSSWTSASDIRDKTDIQEIDHALDFIKKIHPITYVMNEREKYLYRDESGKPLLNKDGKQYYDVEAHARGDKKKHRRFAGVSAQETYQAMLDCYKNDNYAQIVDNSHYDNPESEYLEQYSVEYERFVPFLIKAIQEQQEQIEELKQQLNKQ